MSQGGTDLKVCGLTRAEDVRAAIEAGADYCGFIVEIERSPRSISADRARELVAGCGARPVLVIEGMALRAALRLAEELKVAAVQVHGDVSDDYLASVAQGLFGKAEVWCPIGLPAQVKDRMKTVADILERIERLAALGVARVVLDTRTEAGVGGSGTCCDWQAAAAIVKASALPVMLAGGLSPENLREAIAQVRPAGVDLSSSLEAEPGAKDPERMRELGEVWKQLVDDS